MKNETNEKDNGYKKLLSELAKLKAKPFVKVGIPSENQAERTSDGPITNLQIAVIHEFGTDSVPERSHIRKSFDMNNRDMLKLTSQLKSLIYAGKKTVSESLDIIGIKMVSNIQNVVRSGLKPDVQRGGTPLLDTGQYLASITYVKVEK